VIIFLAGFFAANERFISEYASFKKRFSFFSFAVISIAFALFLFLILAIWGGYGDLLHLHYPVFVFAGRLPVYAGSIIFYVLITWIFKNCLAFSIGYHHHVISGNSIKRKQLSESAIMALIIIAGF